MATSEVGVVVFTGTFVFSLAGFHRVVRKANALVEPVHVELPNKGSIIIVLEEFRDQRFCEFVLVEDDKRIALIGPTN